METNKENQSNQSQQQKKNQLKDYARYSGIAFQMIATILLGLWAGMKLDEHFEVKSHLFTVFLLLFSVISSIYFVIRSLTKTK